MNDPLGEVRDSGGLTVYFMGIIDEWLAGGSASVGGSIGLMQPLRMVRAGEMSWLRPLIGATSPTHSLTRH